MKKLLILAFLGLSAMAAQAVVSINLSGNPVSGPQFSISGGGLMADGRVVRIGTLTAEAPANATFDQLGAIFQEFGRTTTGTDNANGNNTGRILRNNVLGGGEPTSPQPDSFFDGKQVYIWVYGGEENDPTAPQGLFGSATTFKDQATAVSVSMSSFTTALGRFEGGTAASFNPPAQGSTVPSYTLATPIPEPSALAFAALGLTICLGRRKK